MLWRGVLHGLWGGCLLHCGPRWGCRGTAGSTWTSFSLQSVNITPPWTSHGLQGGQPAPPWPSPRLAGWALAPQWTCQVSTRCRACRRLGSRWTVSWSGGGTSNSPLGLGQEDLSLGGAGAISVEPTEGRKVRLKAAPLHPLSLA